MDKTIQEATPATVETLEQRPNASGLPTTYQKERARNGLDDWSKARRALLRQCKKRDAKGLKRLDMLADKVMDMAIAGNMQAIAFVFERLDGKGTQTLDIKQDITVSSIGAAHLHALQRLTDAVTRHDEAEPVSTLDTQAAKTIDHEVIPE